ncbi:MFS transporter [Sphaerisporangium fuscum]|uniref:MFS transporter n=1 Tax=Sphaerisporangium fuscum TaxID=2835868 RepID=UPI001BDC20B4|nr:MFS transporter [Sphaerisporangium fuscum]
MAAAFWFRLARTTAFAVVCLALGVIAHVFAGGTVSVPTAGCGLAVAFAAALPVTGRERGAVLIAPLLAAVQAALHVLFSAAHDTQAIASYVSGHPHPVALPGLGMLLAHGWAALLVGLWLARGEAALWAVLRRLGARAARLVVTWLTTPLPGPAARPAAPPTDLPALRTATLRHKVTRRGPPSLLRGRTPSLTSSR